MTFKKRAMAKLIILFIFGFIFCIYANAQNSSTRSPTDAFTPASMAPGSPSGSYSISDLESISPFSGNLSFNLPLIPVGGRGDIGYSKTLVIENHWQLRDWRYSQGPGGSSTATPIYKPESTHTAIPGLPKPGEIGLLYGRRSRDKTPDPHVGSSGSYTGVTQLTFVGLDGTETSLRDVLTDGVPHICIQAVDGSGGFSRGTVFTDRISNSMTFISDAPIRDLACGDTSFAVMNGLEILRPSGILYIHANGMKVTISNGNVTSMVDRQGNLAYGNGASTDNLGRPVGYDTIKGFGGLPRNVQVIRRPLGEALRSDFALKNYSQLFPGQLMLQSDADAVYNPEVIAEVILPNNKSYKFKYSSYGQLSQVEMPTGGRVEYDWIYSIDDYKLIQLKLTERRLYSSQTSTLWESKTTYGSGGVIGNCPQNVECTIVPVGNYIRESDGTIKNLGSIRHFYHGVVQDFSSDWKPYPKPFDGREFKTEVYDENGNLYSVNETTWNSSSYYAPYPANGNNSGSGLIPTLPYVQESKTTLIEGNKVSKTTFTYDSELRLTDSYQYDYGNLFVSRTHTDYVTDTNYYQKYLRKLPLRTWVSSDVNGTNKVALQEFEYDNYTADSSHSPLLSRSNVIRHDTSNFGANVTLRGNVTSVKGYADPQNPATAISGYSQYDILGNIVKVIDGKGYATTIDYTDKFGAPNAEARSNLSPTELGGLSTFAFPTSSTNALGWVTGYSQFDYYTSQPVDVEDINGVVSSTFYNDPLNRPTQTISANNISNLRRQATVIYDDINRQVTTTADFNSFGDNSIKGESFYDGLGRTFEARKYEDGGYIATKTEYDGLGRARRTTNPFRPWKNEPELWTESKYDSLGRMIEVKTPDNAKVLTSYYSNTVTVTDQAGKQRRSVTNGLGQLIRVDEPDGSNQLGAIDTPTQPTYYEYNTLNNLIKVKQGGTFSAPEQTRNFAYDSLSRLKSATNPESGLIQYSYDNNGNLTMKTDARTVVTSYIYDALNRVTNRNYSAPTGTPPNYEATPNVTYTYDNLPNAKGKLIKVENSLSKTEYTQFDILGRATKSKQTTDGIAYNEMEYVYNLSGAMTEEKYPSGRVVKNVLDNDGDLSIVQSKKTANAGYFNYAENLTYTAAGAVSSMQLGNGKWESTSFNSRLQPTQIALGTVQSGTDKLKLNFDYGTTANNGNVLSQTIIVPTTGSTAGFTAVQTYSYDSLNRINDAKETIGGSQSWKQTFTYDRYGNRRFDTGTDAGGNKTTTLPSGCAVAVCNPTIDPATNKLIGYTFDNAGNTKIDAENRTFTYDGENKQTLVKDSSGNRVGEYFYDGDGNRVKKIEYSGNVATETTIFVYDASGRMVAEYAGNIAPPSTAQVSYLTNDHLGSPRITTDKDGKVFSRRDFMPFGEEIKAGQTAQRSVNLSYGEDGLRQKFTSYERDNETELDFAGARMYSKNYGRFTTPDYFSNDTSVFSPQSWNLYTYVRNNPLIYIDPSGKELVVVINGNSFQAVLCDGKVKLIANNKDGAQPGEGSFEKAVEKMLDDVPYLGTLINYTPMKRGIPNILEIFKTYEGGESVGPPLSVNANTEEFKIIDGKEANTVASTKISANISGDNNASKSILDSAVKNASDALGKEYVTNSENPVGTAGTSTSNGIKPPNQGCPPIPTYKDTINEDPPIPGAPPQDEARPASNNPSVPITPPVQE